MEKEIKPPSKRYTVVFWGVIFITVAVQIVYEIASTKVFLFAGKKELSFFLLLLSLYLCLAYSLCTLEATKKGVPLSVHKPGLKALWILIDPLVVFWRVNFPIKVLITSSTLCVVTLFLMGFLRVEHQFWSWCNNAAYYSGMFSMVLLSKFAHSSELNLTENDAWTFYVLILFPVLEPLRAGKKLKDAWHRITAGKKKKASVFPPQNKGITLLDTEHGDHPKQQHETTPHTDEESGSKHVQSRAAAFLRGGGVDNGKND